MLRLERVLYSAKLYQICRRILLLVILLSLVNFSILRISLSLVEILLSRVVIILCSIGATFQRV